MIVVLTVFLRVLECILFLMSKVTLKIEELEKFEQFIEVI